MSTTERGGGGARRGAPGVGAAATPPHGQSSSSTQRLPDRDATASRDQTARHPADTAPRQQPVTRIVRRRVTVRALEPWSVLKLSVIFYFTVLLLTMLALTVLWSLANTFGLVDAFIGFFQSFSLSVEIDAGNIGRAVFLVGLLAVVVASGVNVFLCFLYNLVADLIGGLKMTLAEEQ